MHLSTLELPYIRHLPKLKSREMRCAIGKLRAMRLLNKSQQVRSNFVISLTFTYQGELSSFMQNSQVFL